MTLLTAKAALESQIKASPPPAVAQPRKLPLAEIGELPDVFQHRTPGAIDQRMHIKELARALRTGNPLEAIAIFWAGKQWVCVDGHHRLAAYRVEKWTRGVPVTVFVGTVSQAMLRAAWNTKDKLRMDKPEKMNTAWRLVITGGLTKRAIVEGASVSDGTVGHMRRVEEALSQREPGIDLSELTWERARRKHLGEDSRTHEDMDDLLQAQAQATADKLVKALGTQKHWTREILLMALEIYDRNLPAAAVEYWHEQARESVEGRKAWDEDEGF